jgi:hypothetical protein
MNLVFNSLNFTKQPTDGLCRYEELHQTVRQNPEENQIHLVEVAE